MNVEKKKENKQVDKKALKIFIPCLLVAFVVGFVLSALGNFMEENLGDIIANGIEAVLRAISPYANLVLNGIGIVVSVIILVNVKKRITTWDGEDEEEYKKIDGSMSVVLMIINVVFIMSYFFFAAGFDYCIVGATLIELICYFAGFIIALAGNMIIQSKVINIYKEMNPEKQGSVYSMDFNKQWEKSCDEAEKLQIYKAAYGSYQFCNIFYIVLWLLCILGNQIWHFGIMPATIVTVIWLAQSISYYAYAAYYAKNPNKV